MNKPDVRKVLIGQLSPFAGQPVGLLLSAGIDSASLLFALLHVGAVPTAYSFTLDHYVSQDFAGARRLAARWHVPFHAVFLPRDLLILQQDLLILARLGATKKTDFECGWPMLYAYQAVREPIVCSGMGADGHFCISKKGMIHYKKDIDTFRRQLYASDSYAQQPIHARLGALYKKKVSMPYLTKPMQEEFLGTTWEEVNRPHQKQAIRDAFPEEFQSMHIQPHTNLQLGDSGIADHCQKLLKTNWNRRGAKSVTAIYHDLVNGQLSV